VDVMGELFVVIAVIIVAEYFGVIHLYKPVLALMVHCNHFSVKQICQNGNYRYAHDEHPDEFGRYHDWYVLFKFFAKEQTRCGV